MVLDGNLVLTDENTISNFEKEYSISEFEDIFENDDFGRYKLEFDEKRKLFIIHIGNNGDYFLLRLNNGRMKLLEEGIIDPALQRLINLANKSQKIKKGREVNENFLETGEYPTDLEGLEAYKDYFEREISKTKARIIKTRAYSALTVGALTGIGSSIVILANNNVASGFVIFSVSLITFGCSVMKNYKYPISRIFRLKRNYNTYKERIKKIEEVSDYLYSKVDEKEIQAATMYSNIFLQEVRNTSELILKLPIEERSKYMDDLGLLLNEYIEQARGMLESDGSTVKIGISSNIWKLNYSMIKRIVKLKGEVENNLALTISKEELANDVKEVQDSLNLLCNNREYKDMRYEMFEEEVKSLC